MRTGVLAAHRRETRVNLARRPGDLVKKPQSNAAGKKAKVASPAAAQAKDAATKRFEPVDVKAVREQITNLVGNHAVSMVDKTIEEANKGHYLAMKYLFEMVGLCPAINSGSGAEEEADSLAKILLERLNIPQESTEVTGEVVADAARLASDNVK